MPAVKWDFFFFHFTLNDDGEMDSTKERQRLSRSFCSLFSLHQHEEWHLRSLTSQPAMHRTMNWPSHRCIKHWAADSSAAVTCSRGNPTIHNPTMRKTRRRQKFLFQINTFKEWKKWDEITFLVGSRKRTRTIESHRLNSNGRTDQKISTNASPVSQTIKRQWHKRAGENVAVSSVVRDGSEKTAVHAGRLKLLSSWPDFFPLRSFFLCFFLPSFLSFFLRLFLLSNQHYHSRPVPQSWTNPRVGVGIDREGREREREKKERNKYKCDATGSALDTQTLNSLLFAKKEKGHNESDRPADITSGEHTARCRWNSFSFDFKIDSLKRFLIWSRLTWQWRKTSPSNTIQELKLSFLFLSLSQSC